MKVSLVLCTLGSTHYLKNFLESLSIQTHKNIELIIVDQNKDTRVNDILSDYKKEIEIIHLKSEPGLSKSRNLGIVNITGNIVGFPDDDCIYPKDLLENIVLEFKQKKYDVLSIKMTNSVKGGRKIQNHTKSKWVKRKDVKKLMASISMFYTKKVVLEVGFFDEKLGLGSKTVFKGSEDYDYPIRAINLGYKIYYDRSIEVYHPWDNIEQQREKDEIKRAFGGGASEMYLANKHNFGTIYKVNLVISRIFKTLIYLITFKVYNFKTSLNILKGNLKYFGYKIIENNE